jgi:hypothetical protein
MNSTVHKALLVLAAYGIVQVLAQDLGVKTGKRQRDLIQSEPILFTLLFAASYAVTDDVTLALAGTGLYYFLKFIYSRGITSNVCFEEV